MALGLATATANAILDALCRSAAWSDPAAFCVKLHTGDPGSAGTANASAETSRKAATFSAASGGAITTSGQLDWTSWPVGANGEVITHVSFWDATSGGNFLGSDALNASRTMNTGDTLSIAAGDIDLTLTVAA